MSPRALRYLKVSGLAAALVACGIAYGHHRRYRYSVIFFSVPDGPGDLVLSGRGSGAVCRSVFVRPTIYIGPCIDIPDDAETFGVIVVSRGYEVGTVPLKTWTGSDGMVRYGCNGPSPSFAMCATDRDELLSKIPKRLAPLRRPNWGIVGRALDRCLRSIGVR